MRKFRYEPPWPVLKAFITFWKLLSTHSLCDAYPSYIWNTASHKLPFFAYSGGVFIFFFVTAALPFSFSWREKHFTKECVGCSSMHCYLLMEFVYVNSFEKLWSVTSWCKEEREWLNHYLVCASIKTRVFRQNIISSFGLLNELCKQELIKDFER